MRSAQSEIIINNIHEKYMQRVKEIEEQEKRNKKDLQYRVDDSELPHIYKKSKVGIQRVLRDPRYENNRDYLKSSHKYGAESENNSTPSLMMGPRIVSHNSKEGNSSRGNLINDSMSPLSSKGISPYDHKIHPYKNGYSSKSYKLAKLKGLPPSSSNKNGKFIIE